MRCLVTGGAGFIGSHLVEQLLLDGHEVVVVDSLVSGRLQNLTNALNSPKFSFFQIDIRDSDALRPIFAGVEWVFHLAGLADIVPSIEMPQDYFNVNVTGTLNILECAKNFGAKRFIYAASSSCYGIPEVYPTTEDSAIRPQYPYALTKYMGEELVLHWEKVYKIPALSLRLFNVYGTRSRTTGAYGAVFGVFIAQKLNGKPMTIVGDGNQTRDFTYVTDVARAFLAAAKSNISGEVLNVGSGDHYSINTLVSLLGGKSIEYIPKRPGEPDCTFANIEKITGLLDWRPEVTFEAGIQKMCSHLDDWRDAPVWDGYSIGEATKVWFKYLDNKEKH